MLASLPTQCDVVEEAVPFRQGFSSATEIIRSEMVVDFYYLLPSAPLLLRRVA